MSSSTLPVSLVCCGLLGTTADDHGILERAFAEACATQGIVPGTAAYAHHMVGVHQAQGQSAVDVFRGLFPDEDGRAEAAALSFERSFRTAVDRTEISPVPGAEEAIGQLSSGVLRHGSDARPRRLRLTHVFCRGPQARVAVGFAADGIRRQRVLEHGREPIRR